MLTKRERAIKFVRRMRARWSGRAESTRPVFVLGAQRSGTNMFLDVLGRSPDVTIYNETDPDAFASFRLKPLGQLAPLVESCATPIAAFKSICDSQRARWLLDVFPDGRAFWLFRDYRDVVNSSLRLFREHRRYLHYVLHEPETADWRAENLSPACLDLIRFHAAREITDASARALIWYLRNQQYFLNHLDDEPYTCLVRYEDLVESPSESWRRVCSFLDIPYQERWTATVSARSVGRYEAPLIDPLIDALCRDMHERLIAAATAQPSFGF